jgi:hypothetical protein
MTAHESEDPLNKILGAVVSASSTETAVNLAVKEFSSLLKSYKNPEDYVWFACRAILQTASLQPQQTQQSLVDFLLKLRQTSLKDPSGNPIIVHGGVVWKDLPNLGWVARDDWNFGKNIITFGERTFRLRTFTASEF